jgi:tetratricopeptide (TPR) repeat protein
MFLAERTGRNLPSMTMRDFFTHIVETAIADTELPAPNRYRLLRDLAPRAMEVGATEASERAAREVLALAPVVHGEGSQRVANALDTLAAIALQNRGAGAIDEARPMLERAASIYAALGMHGDVDYLSHLRARMRLDFFGGDPAAALETVKQALALAIAHPELPATIELQYRSDLSNLYRMNGKPVEAGVAADEAVARARELAGDDPAIAQMLDMMRANACSMHARGDPPRGATLCAELVADLTRADRLQTPIGVEALFGLGSAQGRTGRSEEALANYQRAERVQVALEGEDALSRMRLSLLRAIGTRSFALGRYDQAIAAQRRALAPGIAQMGVASPDAMGLRMELVDSLLAAHRRAEAAALLREAQDLSRLDVEQRKRWDALLRSAGMGDAT